MPKAKSKNPIAPAVGIGDCTLILGDCLSFIPQLDWHSIDLLLTDPPFGINHSSNFWVKPEDRKLQRHASGQTKSFKVIDNDHSLDAFFKMLEAIGGKLKANAGIYVFCSPKNIELVLPPIKASYNLKNILVWDKDNWGAGDLKGSYGFQYENIIYAVKGKTRKLNWRIGDILQYPRVPDTKFLHPHQKPTALISKLILNSTDEGDLVCDPFLGSGVTAECCAKLGRRFIGYELNREYFNTAIRLVENATGAIKNLPLDALGEVISD